MSARLKNRILGASVDSFCHTGPFWERKIQNHKNEKKFIQQQNSIPRNFAAFLKRSEILRGREILGFPHNFFFREINFRQSCCLPYLLLHEHDAFKGVAVPVCACHFNLSSSILRRGQSQSKTHSDRTHRDRGTRLF